MNKIDPSVFKQFEYFVFMACFNNNINNDQSKAQILLFFIFIIALQSFTTCDFSVLFFNESVCVY